MINRVWQITQYVPSLFVIPLDFFMSAERPILLSWNPHGSWMIVGKSHYPSPYMQHMGYIHRIPIVFFVLPLLPLVKPAYFVAACPPIPGFLSWEATLLAALPTLAVVVGKHRSFPNPWVYSRTLYFSGGEILHLGNLYCFLKIPQLFGLFHHLRVISIGINQLG